MKKYLVTLLHAYPRPVEEVTVEADFIEVKEHSITFKADFKVVAIYPAAITMVVSK